MKKIILPIFFSCLVITLFAQDTTQNEKEEEATASIYLKAKATDQGLILRWAPTNYSTWMKGNSFGYTVEKLIIDKSDNKSFSPVGKKVFKPWPMEDWKAIVNDSSPYVAAAAMTLFGKKEVINSDNFIDASEDLDNRFSFALLSADLDKRAAEASGLYYLDKSIPKYNMVVYRIYIVDSESKAVSDTTYQLFNYGEVTPFKGPSIEAVYEGDYSVSLMWKKRESGNQYTGFYIERSDDNGATFERRTKNPFLDMATNAKQNKEYITFTDSLQQNYKAYQYRLVALDAFGEASKPGEMKIAMGRDKTPPTSPQNFITKETPEHAMELQWTHELKDPDFIGFRVYRSTRDNAFIPLSELLPPASRSFIDKTPDARLTNYYQVMAVDTAGNEGASAVKYGLVTDATPPQAPTNLRAKIDSLGILLLEWDAPKDKDILGYHVYYSNINGATSDFAVKAGNYLPNNHFAEKLELQTLSEDIYYYVIAADFSYNTSPASTILKVKKPDVIPPVASIFVDYNVTEEGIYFKWNKSTSDDVEKVELKRRTLNSDWQIVSNFDQNKNSYLDKNVIEGMYYEYALWTIDDDNNITVTEKTLRLSALKSFYLKDTPKITAKIENNAVVIDIQHPIIKGHEYVLYRAQGESALETYKIISPTLKFIDSESSTIKPFTYVLKVRAPDGRESKLSEPTKINY